MKLQPFPLEQVRLLEGPFKTGQDINRRYLDSLDAERLLKSFRVNAGLPAPGEPLTGWEAPDCEIRGYSTGHYLSALALMFASTGDEALKEKGAYSVSELAKVQAALGKGYLSAFPESHWDRVEAAQPNWAQYYVIHKIMAGMLDQYQLCGNRQALDVLEGMAAYFKMRFDRLTQYQIDKALSVTEEGGISEVLWNLYAVTRNADHRGLAERFEKAAFLGPLALQHDNLSHLHGNTHIPLAIGAARHYELTGDDRYRTIAEYFWDRVVNTRTYATGGTTSLEVWPEPGRLAETLGYKNQECCKTYNMLKLTRHLIAWTADANYGDYYERALFNSILGTQESAQGRLMYYIPLATGFQKSVLSHSNHFYCCNGTGIESFGKFGDSIYFHDDQGIYVNLFISSTVSWPEKGLRLEQVTRFPEEAGAKLTIHLDQPVKFPIHIRVPYWANQGVHVRINGKDHLAQAVPTSYLTLNRRWKAGDVVEVHMPMSLHVQPMPDDQDLMAFMYGPLVLAGVTEPDNAHTPYIIPPGGDFPDGDQHPNYDFFPADPARLEDWLKPVVGQPLTFRTLGQPIDYTFVPFYQITGERYGVYWVVTQEGTPRYQKLMADAADRRAEEEAVRRRAERQIDRVIPGNTASEKAHDLQGEGTRTGPWKGKHWRDAADGWWSWTLAVLPDTPATLLCVYWGSDVGRTFQILVDERLLAEERLENRRPEHFVEVEYPIPAKLTRGKDRVTVTFRAAKGSLAGGVFDCRTLKLAADNP
jgi:hypothetical protein